MRTEAPVYRKAADQDRPGILEYGYWAFLLVAVGRVNQLVPGLTLLPMAKIAMAFTILATLVNRRELPPRTTIGRALGRTGAWIAVLALVLTPGSFWRGASLGFLMTRLPVLVVSVWVASRMRTSWRSLRSTLLVLVLCGLILAKSAVSGYSGGRADDAGTMYDPNDLAYLLVTLVPLSVAFVISSKSRLFRILYAMALAVVIAALLLTQSRGGLLGFVTVVALMTFLPMKIVSRGTKGANKTWSVKLATVLVVGMLSVVAWSQLPEGAQKRFSTLLHLGSDYNTNLKDKTGRGDIWLRGLRAAEQRPWGYGPQSYPMVDMRFGGKFKAPHNSFLQMLVELGVLGLLLFGRMYYLAIRGLQRIRKSFTSLVSLTQEQADQALFARAIQFSLAGNIVSGFFLSEAYAQIIWVTFGLCVSLCAISAGVSAPLGTNPSRP